jgi:hypothetical protein
MRLELNTTPHEHKLLVIAAKDHGLPLATYVRYAVLKHTEYIVAFRKKQAEEYIKYQFNDKPVPLSKRMNWKPVIATKEDLITNEKL